MTERDGKIYSRESDEEPVCAKVTVLALVERGWLRPWRSRYTAAVTSAAAAA